MRTRGFVTGVSAVFAVAALLLFGALAGYGTREAARGGPGVDPARAERLAEAARSIRALGVNALPLLDTYIDSDPENAFGYYLLAAAHARQGGWAAVMQALRAGNRAPRCQHYVPRESPAAGAWEAIAPLMALRQDILDAARMLPGQEAGALLFECRRMAERVAGAEPASLALLEAGTRMRRDFSHATVLLAQRAGEGWRADQARAEEKADQARLARIAEVRERLRADAESGNAEAVPGGEAERAAVARLLAAEASSSAAPGTAAAGRQVADGAHR